jgi:hypothetical protein
MRVKESSASFKNKNLNPWPEINWTTPAVCFSAKSFLIYLDPKVILSLT